MTRPQVLLLPGWHTRDAARAWAAQVPHAVVVGQHDWQRPLRGDWVMQLENAVLAAPASDEPDIVLLAEGLGCWLVAAWAQVSRWTSRVRAAALMAPTVLDTPEMQARLPSWQRISPRPLPFEATVLCMPATQAAGSQTDHAPKHAAWARAWGARYLPDLQNASTDSFAQALNALLNEDITHGH